MAWQTPKTNWQAADVVSKDDFNRIEGNIQELQNTKETPAGAQAKAGAAETNAKSHANGLVGILSSLATTAKNNIVAAINEIHSWLGQLDNDFNTHQNDFNTHQAEKATETKLGHVKAKTKADGTLIIPISPETAALYGLTGDDATVDGALKLTTNARFYGKYSQMSGGSGIIEDSGDESSIVQGFISFANEDNDDFNSINLASSYSRVTIPAGITKVVFMLRGVVRCSYSSTVIISLYKNGSLHCEMASMKLRIGSTTVSTRKEIGATFLSEPVECSAGDYFEIHVHASGVRNKGLYAGSVLRMEVLR